MEGVNTCKQNYIIRPICPLQDNGSLIGTLLKIKNPINKFMVYFIKIYGYLYLLLALYVHGELLLSQILKTTSHLLIFNIILISIITTYICDSRVAHLNC